MCAVFESELLTYMESEHADLLETIRTTGQLEDDTSEKLAQAVEQFKKGFAASE